MNITYLFIHTIHITAELMYVLGYIHSLAASSYPFYYPEQALYTRAHDGG